MSAKSDDIDTTPLLFMFALPLVLIFIVPVLLWFGWAASILWGWFVVPTFGLPALSISQSAGLALVASSFRVKLSSPKNSLSGVETAFLIVIGPPLVVAMGWIIKWSAL